MTAQTSVPARVLFVCTANQCRSPLAEAIARRQLHDLPIEFESAGLIKGGVATPRVGIDVAAERGLDLHEHLSRQLDRSRAPGFDLILTMSRSISRDLVAGDPELWPRVFTVKQFSRWAAEHPKPVGVALGPWIDAEARGRARTDLLGNSEADDVVDPFTSSARVWRSVADELELHIADGFRALYAPQGSASS